MQPTSRPDLANNRSSMRMFEGRYYKINRWLLMCLGLWPYEDKIKKYVLRTIAIGSLTLCIVPQLISAVVHYEDMDRLMLSVFIFLLLTLMALKVIGMISAQANMSQLFKSIVKNWEQFQNGRERDILREYSERAKNVTVFFVALNGTAVMALSITPLFPELLNMMKPLQNPRPHMYLSATELFIDRETHFLLYLVLEFIGNMMIALATTATVTMYIVTVEHCCALYAIIRSRLLELKSLQETPTTADADSYQWLRSTIQIHQEALTYTSLVNDSYATTFLFVAIIALVMIPLNSCAIIANLDNTLHLIPYAAGFVAIIINGFFLCYPAQRIIDHQLGLLDAAYCSEWYVAPLRTKKLLLIFMLRCSQPAMITAGDLLEGNLELFFKVVKTALSYITVLASFR